MSLPSVSIILVNLNGQHHFEKLFESLRAVDYPRDLLEIVVRHCLARGYELVGTGVDRERAAERLITAGCAVATGSHLAEPRPVGDEFWARLAADSVTGR